MLRRTKRTRWHAIMRAEALRFDMTAREVEVIVTYRTRRVSAYSAYIGRYLVHDDTCTCPDWEYRRRRNGGVCKHMIALMLLWTRADADKRTRTETEAY